MKGYKKYFGVNFKVTNGSKRHILLILTIVGLFTAIFVIFYCSKTFDVTVRVLQNTSGTYYYKFWPYLRLEMGQK